MKSTGRQRLCKDFLMFFWRFSFFFLDFLSRFWIIWKPGTRCTCYTNEFLKNGWNGLKSPRTKLWSQWFFYKIPAVSLLKPFMEQIVHLFQRPKSKWSFGSGVKFEWKLWLWIFKTCKTNRRSVKLSLSSFWG